MHPRGGAEDKQRSRSNTLDGVLSDGLMTTLQLLGEYPCHPEAVYLLDQLLGYIQGEEF